jgi:hypothetical protein
MYQDVKPDITESASHVDVPWTMERLEAEILKGIRSGKSEPMTDQDWVDIRAEVLRRHEARMAQRGLKPQPKSNP